MAKKLGELLDTIPHKNWCIGLIALNLLLIAAVFVSRNILPPVVPLYYGKPTGTEQLAPENFLALPPTIAVTICLINSAGGYFIKDDFLQRVLVGGMVAGTLLSLITVIKIVLLVGNI